MSLIVDLLMDGYVVISMKHKHFAPLRTRSSQASDSLFTVSEFVYIISVGHTLDMCGHLKDRNMTLFGHFEVKMKLSEV